MHAPESLHCNMAEIAHYKHRGAVPLTLQWEWAAPVAAAPVEHKLNSWPEPRWWIILVSSHCKRYRCVRFGVAASFSRFYSALHTAWSESCSPLCTKGFLLCVRPLVYPSVRPSVRPSVGRLVHTLGCHRMRSRCSRIPLNPSALANLSHHSLVVHSEKNDRSCIQPNKPLLGWLTRELVLGDSPESYVIPSYPSTDFRYVVGVSRMQHSMHSGRRSTQTCACIYRYTP